MQFEGIRAVVTGGLSGLGAATARAVAAGGGQVAVLDRAPEGDTTTDATTEAAIRVMPTDVTDPDQVEAAVEAAVDAMGGIDLCVGCAGVADAARVVGRDGQPFPRDLFRKVVEVNLLGLFDVARLCAARMADNEPNADGERGVIVNVASIAGIEGQAGQAAYAASKGGVIALTLPMARDLSSRGIRVVTVCPGTFETGMLAATDRKVVDRLVESQVFPKRLGQPDELAHLVRAIVENPMLNGEVIRLDAAVRLSHG